jgi:hypothetical protein
MNLWSQRPIAAVAGVGLLVAAMPVRADTALDALNCQIGSSVRWGSSWCNLNPPKDFSAGSTMEININPDGAQVVLVRLLAQDAEANDPLGIVGGKRPVPRDGKIVLKLDRDYKNIKQISVHGGTAAWDYSLGESNKGALIQGVVISH